MFNMVLPLYLSWKDLKSKIGWPYSRTHTSRSSEARCSSRWRPQLC